MNNTANGLNAVAPNYDDSVGEFSRGWLVLLACLIGVTAGFSSTYFYSSGLFLVPVAKELGLTRGQVSMSPLFCYLTAAVVAPVIGRAVDRFGPIMISLVSGLGLSLGFFLLANFTQSLSTFIALSMLIAILGAGTTAVSFSRMIVATFRKRRGVAFGIMLTGPGVGAILIPALLLPYLAEAGWRSAYQALGIVVLVACAVVGCILYTQRALIAAGSKDAASSEVPNASVRTIWLSAPFLLLGGIFLLAALGVISVVVHFVPMLVDAGITAASAAKLASSIGFAVIFGRLLTGYLLDKIDAELIALGMFGLVVVGLALLALGGSAMALPGAVISGLAVGAEIDLLAFLTARYFTVRSYGTAYGGIFGLFLIGGAIGPGMTGKLYDITGSYKVPLICAIGFMAVACILLYALRVGRSRWQKI
ncbi:Cyanate permease [Variovorax sp. HW608]|jgi:MFS family permease|uniref:MFS transporter n=1 Tax=Variovorax sp. HW608 TaxID=1034889 RepID=UPI00081F825B|nr:MFS transporter [Variovorax sp. HW608]SCK37317.1 Cyanate permease [Variovorax sp. HW608]